MKQYMVEIITALAVVALLSALVWLLVSVSQYRHETEVRAYHAWVKQTGNPQQLTQEEWIDLAHVSQWQREREAGQ